MTGLFICRVGGFGGANRSANLLEPTRRDMSGAGGGSILAAAALAAALLGFFSTGLGVGT